VPAHGPGRPECGAVVISVVVTGAIKLYREGLTLLLENDERFRPVAAPNLGETIRLLTELDPDVVVVDGTLPEGVKGVRRILGVGSKARVVVLGVSDEEAEIVEYAEAGVSGYVSREADAASLRDTVAAVARGETHCSPQVAAALLRRVAALAADRPAQRSPAQLTNRECEVVDLIRQGCSNKEIARRLFIEPATVKNHVHHILAKLEVRRRGDVAEALRE
jgi:two-component system, NarL family, nitrate/nitrite response regulator NarL